MSNSSKFSAKKLIIILIIVILLVVIAAFVFVKMGTGAVNSSDTNEVTVEVTSGSGTYDILNALDEAGLVKNKMAAKIYVKLFAPENLQANTYVLNKSMSLSDILDIINKGEFKYILKTKFTIIEGATYKDAVGSISKELKIDKNEIIKKWSDEAYLKTLISKYWFLTDEILAKGIKCPLEGYIYPNTYFVTEKNPTIESLTEQILDLLDEKLKPYKDDIAKSKMTVHQMLTFASVVENESLFEKDRPKIAGVFINRLNQNMMLQSDITVLYALGEKRVDVTLEDLKVDSKYNTYKYEGLPIGPVSNPSIETIKDCLNYEKSDYIYFFATKEGKVIYSKTLAEHEKAVEKYGWY